MSRLSCITLIFRAGLFMAGAMFASMAQAQTAPYYVDHTFHNTQYAAADCNQAADGCTYAQAAQSICGTTTICNKSNQWAGTYRVDDKVACVGTVAGYIGSICTASVTRTLRVACVAPQVRDPATSQCVNPCPAAGTPFSDGYIDIGTSSENSIGDDPSRPNLACDGGCETSFTGTGTPVARSMQNGAYRYYAQGSYDYTGQSCSTGGGSPQPTTSPPESSCTAEQQRGEVNGVTVCLPKSKTSDETKTTTTDPTTGDKTETTTKDNADGSKDTTTTTTTTNPATGEQTQTTTKTTDAPPLSPFCEANPQDPTCRTEDKWTSGLSTTKGFDHEALNDELEASKLLLGSKVNEIRGEISAKLGGPASALGGSLPCSSVTVLGGEFKVCLQDYSDTLAMIGNALLAIATLIAVLLIFS